MRYIHEKAIVLTEEEVKQKKYAKECLTAQIVLVEGDGGKLTLAKARHNGLGFYDLTYSSTDRPKRTENLTIPSFI